MAVPNARVVTGFPNPKSAKYIYMKCVMQKKNNKEDLSCIITLHVLLTRMFSGLRSNCMTGGEALCIKTSAWHI